MNISEERLKELIQNALKELAAEKSAKTKAENRQKLYMVCGDYWVEGYRQFLLEMEKQTAYDIYPVIPASWQKQGYEEILRSCKACEDIIYRPGERPADLATAVSLFPAVSRDMLVKTALCLGDTFETSWVADCIKKGSRIVFWRSGLEKFSGMEKPAYVKRIMDYCRQVLEYGIEICGVEELTGTEKTGQLKTTARQATVSKPKKRRVISAAQVEQLAPAKILYLQPGDIVTDLARDRAKFLNIEFK